jgi:hypothetical protein
MGFTLEARCPEHDAGTAELPCPWPECVNGCSKDIIERQVGRYAQAFRRARNVTDGGTVTWWAWQQLTRPR